MGFQGLLAALALPACAPCDWLVFRVRCFPWPRALSASVEQSGSRLGLLLGKVCALPPQWRFSGPAQPLSSLVFSCPRPLSLLQ